MNRHLASAAMLVLIVGSLAGAGGGLSIGTSAIVAGGGTSSARGLTLTGIVGQMSASGVPSAGGAYSLTSGFWNAGTTTPPCPADLDANGSVGASDLSALLASWGDSGGSADLDGNGTVGASDLSLLLADWGACS